MPRPPRLPDATILALINELRVEQPALTGTRLREELTHRHGSPCGVARVYRLLREATQPRRVPFSPAPQSTGDASQLLLERDAALKRAALAEHREEHHQSRWAGEIHALREQVQQHREAAHRLPVLEREVRDRSRELAAAYLRIADLEEELIRLRSPENL
jgi:hypothetical protein